MAANSLVMIDIEGFKSFNERVTIGPLDRVHNLFVGRRDVGKTCIINALRFVLSGDYDVPNACALFHILHQSAGATCLTATVHVLFHIEKENDRTQSKKWHKFTRRMSMESDQLCVDDRKSSRDAISGLLVSVGFSSTNPYHSLNDGVVERYAGLDDFKRWQEFETFAGQSVCEKNVAVFERNLGAADANIELMTNTSLKDIQEKLSFMTANLADFNQRSELEENLRACNYVVIASEYDQIIQEIAMLPDVNAMTTELSGAERGVEASRKKLRDLSLGVELADILRQLTTDQYVSYQTYVNAIKHAMAKKVALQEKEEFLTGDKAAYEKHLEELAMEHRVKEEELAALKEQAKDVGERRATLLDEYSAAMDKYHELFSRNVGDSTFTVPQRANYRDVSLNILRLQVPHCNSRIARFEESIVDKEAVVAETLEKMKMQEEGHGKLWRKWGEKMKEIRVVEANLVQAMEDRSDHVQSANDWKAELERMEIDLRDLEKSLQSTATEDVIEGLNSVKVALQSLINAGGNNRLATHYSGTLIDNFTCDPDLNVAVQSVVGEKLFHHIVKSKKVAVRLRAEMDRLDLPGTASFIVRDRMPRSMQLSLVDGDRPLLKALMFDTWMQPVMLHVCGETLIVDSSEVKSVAAERGVQCVSLDGLLCHSAGVQITPRDHSLTALSVNSEIKKKAGDIAQKTVELEDAEKLVNASQERISAIKRLLQKCTKKIHSIECELGELEIETAGSLERTLGLASEFLTLMRWKTFVVEAEKKEHQQGIARFEAELARVFTPLSADEMQQMHQYGINRLVLRRTVEGLQGELESFEKQKNLSHVNLEQNEEQTRSAQRKLVEARARLQDYRDQQNQLPSLKTLLADKTARLGTLKTKSVEAEESAEKASADLSRERNNHENAAEALMKLQHQRKEADRAHQSLEGLKEEKAGSLRANGKLPTKQLMEKYKHLDATQLKARCLALAEEIGGMTHVQRHDPAKYKKLQRIQANCLQDIATKKKERDSLIEVAGLLKAKKDQIFTKTLNKVANYFSLTFSRLVPQGCAEIKLFEQRGAQRPHHLEINANFSSADESACKTLRLLSKREKYLAALSFVIASQCVDVSPVLLVDDLGKELNAVSRQHLATTMAAIPNHGQFISVSGRSESVGCAGKVFLVTHTDGRTQVTSVTKEVAIASIR